MIERLRTRKQQQQLDSHRRRFLDLNSSSEQKTSLKRLSKSHKRNRLAQFFFPTRSRIKLHQSQLSTNNKQTTSPLNEQVAKLNQRAVDVRTGIEHSISSLHTQRLQHLTTINEKTRDLEKAAADFEYSSSKHLKQELDKTKKLSYIFKIAIALCLSLFSFMIGYMIIQLMRDKGTV
jgi:tetrahydromethanopterin S-methyltransferase subunit B